MLSSIILDIFLKYLCSHSKLEKPIPSKFIVDVEIFWITPYRKISS